MIETIGEKTVVNKSLCKLRRVEILGQIKLIQQVVDKPAFLCRSCARVANRAAALCKPVELPKGGDGQPEKKPQAEKIRKPTKSKKARKAQKKQNKKLKKLLKLQQKLMKQYQKNSKKYKKLTK